MLLLLADEDGRGRGTHGRLLGVGALEEDFPGQGTSRGYAAKLRMGRSA